MTPNIDNESPNVTVNELRQLDAASLSKLITELQQSKADLEARRFVETSLAKFADLMRWQANDNLSSWVDRLLGELALTVGALQACMYMTSQKTDSNTMNVDNNIQSDGESYSLKEETRELILIGAYANDDENSLSRVKFGKGLIGQAAKSKRMILFNQNAKIETRTFTGLALLHPQSLIMQPLIYNEIVEGVLEISSVEEFTHQQLDFLRLLSEAIAANLMTIRSQEEMRHLYIAMQTKTESLTAQEEEMRQNMEEMAATQEEMARLRAQAEQQAALQTSTIDSFHDGIIAVNSKLEVILYNEAAKKLIETRGDELEKEKSIEIYYKEETREAQKGNWVRALNGDSFSTEESILAPDGKTKLIFHYHFSPIFNLKRTEMLGACALLRDVTEERKRQIEIEDLKIKAERQSNFLQSLLDGMQNGVIAIDNRHNVRLFNKLATEICENFGLDIQVGNPFIELIHPEQRNEFIQFTHEALSGKMTVVTIFYRFTETDQGAWFDISFIPIIENDGSISGVIVEFEDINEKKLQSIEIEELKNSAVSQSAMLQSMIDGMNSGIIMLNLLYEIRLINTLASKFTQGLGYNFKMGDHFLDSLTEEGRKIFEGYLQKASIGGITHITIPFNSPDKGEQGWADISFVPVFETESRISGIIIEFKDVTEKEKQHIKIEELSKAAVEERNLRQRVIDNMDVELLAIDRDYKLTVINEPALSLFRKFGIPIQPGIYIGEAMDPDYRDIILADWRLSMGGEAIRKLNKYRFSQDDDEQTYEVNYTPAYNSDKSEIEGVVVLFRNITRAALQSSQIEQIKEDAITQKKYLESIFNGFSYPMLAIDKNFTLTAFNENAVQFFANLKVGLVVGLKIDVVYGNKYDAIIKNFRQVLEKGETFTEMEMMMNNTNHILLETTYGPIKDENKEVTGAWITMKDLSNIEIQKQLLQRKLEEIDKAEKIFKAEKLKMDKKQ